MKVIIAGCRDWEGSYNYIDESVQATGWRITELVSGMQRGMDMAGVRWANKEGIPVKPYPYEGQYGKAGGPIRNAKMAAYADALIAFWDGKSRGTLDMITAMRQQNKPYRVFPLGNVNLIDKLKQE